MNRISMIAWLVSFVSLSWSGTASAQDEVRPVYDLLPIGHQALLTSWLQQDCQVGTEEIKKDMILFGAELEAALIEAYELGPMGYYVMELDSTLHEQYWLRMRWLLAKGRKLLDPGAEEVLAESEEAFNAAEQQKLVNRWRDAAIAGLALVCSEASLPLLESIASDPENPSSVAALVALETSGSCRHGQ